jgi:hypothetical protein
LTFAERKAQKLDMTNELFAVNFIYRHLDWSQTRLGNVLLPCYLNMRFSIYDAANVVVNLGRTVLVQSLMQRQVMKTRCIRENNVIQVG